MLTIVIGLDFTLEHKTKRKDYCLSPLRDCDLNGLAAFAAHNHEVKCDNPFERMEISSNALELSTKNKFACIAQKDNWVVQVNTLQVITLICRKPVNTNKFFYRQIIRFQMEKQLLLSCLCLQLHVLCLTR